MSAKILVVGSINQDIVIKCSRIPKPGETVVGNNQKFYSGGKGLNQAIASKNVHNNVKFVGKLGNDFFGKNLINYFDEIGLKYAIDIVDESATGTALIQVDPKGKNAITLNKGANDKFVLADLEHLRDYSESDILLVQNEINQKFNHQLIEAAHLKGLTVLFNPAPSYPTPKKVLSFCDYVIVNEHELEEVFRTKNFNEIADLDVELLRLAQEYDTEIILTIGKLGSVATHNNSIIRNNGHSVSVMDTTGAGDCFCGVLASAISRGLSMHQSLNLANKAASMSVTKAGANISFPSAKTLNDVPN